MSDEQLPINKSASNRPMPPVALHSTAGTTVDLSDPSLGDYILFIYPRIGRPDRLEAAEWAILPGAKGCTAESCEFRDLAGDYARIGFSIMGLSTQDTTYQGEAVERLHLPYPLLSDPDTHLADALGLEVFIFESELLYKRCTLVVRDGRLIEVHSTIADPASHPGELLTMLEGAH
jgi:peroxiredoxin